MFVSIIKHKFYHLLKLCEEQVSRYGEQYFFFGIFGVINYPISYLYRVHFEHLPETESLSLRLTATILCLPLIFHKTIPNKLKKFLPLYWYFTLTFSIGFLGPFLLIKNNFSLEWVINMGVGLFILILLIDWLMFIILMAIGGILAVLSYYIYYGGFIINWDHSVHDLGLYLYSCILICGIIFSRNKQKYQTDLLDVKNKLNKELNKRIEKKSQDLLKALESNKTFLQNISHELRTPIHNITGLVEILKSDDGLLSKQRYSKLLNMVYRSAYSLSEMVNNIIDLSFFSSHKVVFNFNKVKFQQLVSSCIENGEAYLESCNKKIRILLDYKPNPDLIVELDEVKIKQAINNLISNAIKYSNDDSKNIKISVQADNLNLIFEIQDDGIGIPDGEEELVFNAFARSTQKKIRVQGKGLGLSIVKNIIDGHNGKIWVESKVKKGAKFIFVIPLKHN